MCYGNLEMLGAHKFFKITKNYDNIESREKDIKIANTMWVSAYKMHGVTLTPYDEYKYAISYVQSYIPFYI